MKINEEIRALNWKEPFGSLMLPPHNKIETRIWHTNYRGLVLICISQKDYAWNTVSDIAGDKQFMRILDVSGEHRFTDVPRGYAVAIGRLINSRPMKKTDEDLTFVEFHSDLFCHVYEDVRLINPIPWKGGQKWRRVSQEIINQIEFI